MQELNGKEIAGWFYDKQLQKTKQARLENLPKKKVKKYMLSGYVVVIHLIAPQIKKKGIVI